jgi:hypothetical protein
MTIAAPEQLTLPATPGFLAALLAELLAAPGPLAVDLGATTEIDLAGLQLLLAAARDPRITFTPLPSPPLEAVCFAAGVSTDIFNPGASHV